MSGVQRIAVVGTTGSGKTTLAKQLASALDLPHVELDALQWGADWKPADPAAFRSDVTSALASDRWVVDGNYGAVRDVVWARADTIVWLDYSVGTVLRRLIARTFRRVLGRVVLWSGNRERFWVQFASRDSIFLWMFRTHWRRRRTYGALLATPEHAHRNVVRLFAPSETDAWLQRIRSTAALGVPVGGSSVGNVRS
jgi:adenylate kinase family enzyme